MASLRGSARTVRKAWKRERSTLEVEKIDLLAGPYNLALGDLLYALEDFVQPPAIEQIPLLFSENTVITLRPVEMDQEVRIRLGDQEEDTATFGAPGEINPVILDELHSATDVRKPVAALLQLRQNLVNPGLRLIRQGRRIPRKNN